jgi:hypothetical protein
MRIISSFHDYYDVGQSLGQDQSLIYIREEKEIENAGQQLPCLTFRRNYIDIAPFIIGFCGKIYPVLQTKIWETNYIPTSLCFTLEDVDAYIHQHCKKKAVEIYHSKPEKCYKYRQNMPSRTSFEKYFAHYEVEKEKHKTFFEKYGVPVFVVQVVWPHDQCHLTLNACLRRYEFFRVLDPYTAFQELQMYMGNIAQPDRSIPKVSDRDLATAKGFDKWSFRKPGRKA